MRLVVPGILAVGLAGLSGLGGCGLKGPLYLPEKAGNVVVRPAAGAAAPATEAGKPADTAPTPAPPAQTPPPDADIEPEVAPPGDVGG